MDPLAIYGNEIWQDALRPRHRVVRPNTMEEIAAFARVLAATPRLVYSTLARKWILRDG